MLLVNFSIFFCAHKQLFVKFKGHSISQFFSLYQVKDDNINNAKRWILCLKKILESQNKLHLIRNKIINQINVPFARFVKNMDNNSKF